MKRGRILAAAALLALLMSTADGMVRSAAAGREAAGEVVRLHIVAASDETEDQARKLQVRDALAQLLSPDLSVCRDKAEAEAWIAARLPEIEDCVREVLKREGAPPAVTVRLATRHFPLRRYGRLTLPAGSYTALTITLGSGRGHNWWCVMYPPLCYSGDRPEKEEEAIRFLEQRLSEETMDCLLSDGQTTFRSPLFEALQRLISRGRTQ